MQFRSNARKAGVHMRMGHSDGQMLPEAHEGASQAIHAVTRAASRCATAEVIPPSSAWGGRPVGPGRWSSSSSSSAASSAGAVVVGAACTSFPSAWQATLLQAQDRLLQA
jgi:hypothetical protein